MLKINNAEHKVLIVDDDKSVMEILLRMVSGEGYECQSVASAEEALEVLEKDQFSLMLSDINMPEINGIDLLKISRTKFNDMAVIMATGIDDRKLAIQTLELGAYGYIVKPFDRNEVAINVANALRFREMELLSRRHTNELEDLVTVKTSKLDQAEKAARISRDEVFSLLAKAAEYRDNDTGQHNLRMGHYCRMMARKIGLSFEKCELIQQASQLHDVGNIGVPDNILFKKGMLTEEEFEHIKKHPSLGYMILNGSRSEGLQMAATIAATHHEKFDGTGYPKGLSGEDIPIEGRIAAICDVFDTLTSDRVYKLAMPAADALNIMRKERGKLFDPKLLDLFLESISEVLVVNQKFADHQDG